jgi:integrase/recombinase XerD
LSHPDFPLAEKWLLRYAPKTQSSYKNDLTAFFTSIGKKRLAKVSKEDIVAFLDSSETASVSSRRLGVIKTFYNFAIQEQSLAVNPALSIKLAKTDVRTESYRSIDEAVIQQMLNTADKLRDKVLLHLAYSCALRVEEAVSLTWQDVQINKGNGIINVPGSYARSISLTQEVIRDLNKLRRRKSDNEFVFESRFGQSLSKRQINRILASLGEAVGVSNVTIGRLRNAYAEHALNSGIGLDEVHTKLGNKSFKTTANHLQVLIKKAKFSPSRKKLVSLPVTTSIDLKLRDEDFARESQEFLELDSLLKPSVAQRKRLANLRERLATEVTRRFREGIKLPPNSNRLPQNVPLSGIQIVTLLHMLDEARLIVDMRISRLNSHEEKASLLKQIPVLDYLYSLLFEYNIVGE